MEGSRQRYANQNHSVALRGPEKAFVEGVAGVRSVLGEAKHSETNNTNPTTTANTALRPKGTLRVASHTRLHTMGTHNATPAVLLTREEVRICREAFDASARNPVLQQIFRTHSAKAMEEVPAVSSLTNPISKRRVQQQQQQHQQRPTNQKSASSSTAIPPPEATAALQMMGLSLPQGITSATLRRQQNVDFDAFIDIVTRIKQTFKGDPTRDGDVVEAFVGMGGDAGDLSKGISAKALQIAVHELGLEFDETEKVDAEGDVADVDEAEYALNAVAQGGTLYDHHRLLPFRGFKSLLSTFRAGVYCVIAAMRLRRSRMPWFLDSVRIASFPSSQRHVARTKADFKPADSWEGRRHGYYFARGVLGIGYYRILGELPQFHSAAQAAKECGFAPPLRTHPILAESSEEEDEATPATTKLRNKIAKGKDLLQSVLEGEWKLVKSTREQKQNIDSIFERIHRTMDEDDPYVASEGSSSMSPTSAALSDNPFGNSVFETRVQLTPGIRRRNLRAPPKPELTLSPLSPLSPRSPGFVTSPRKSKVPKGTPKVKSPIKPSSPAKLREVGVESSVFSAAQREHAEGPVGNDFVQTLLSVLRLTAEQRKDIEQVMPEAAPETATSSDPHHLGKNPFSETSDAIEEIADVLNDLRSPLPQRHTLHRKNEDPQPRRAPKLRKVEAPLQEKYGFKHTAVLLREAVFCAMANAKADRLTALWKRDYTRDVTDPSVEARNRVLDYSWQRWCAREEDENRNPSDGISRTYSQRLGELDDQYDSGSDEDYVGDPENGRRLARYAQEMGLRSTTGDVDDAEIEDILERISDLSDMAEDRVVLFEEFAAFFDKYRVYKAHTNVGTFSLRKPNSKETKLTSRIPLLTDAPEVQPTAPLQITDTPNESVSPTDNSSTVLITSGGAFIKPCANITYKNTPRSEDGVLKKGGSRFLPIDWDTIETRLQESKEHRLLLDTPETIAMKQSLGSYMLKAGNHEGEIPQNHSDEEVEDEEEAVPDVAEVVAAQRWEEKLLQEEAAEARRVYVIEELSRRQEEQQNRKDDFTRLAVQKFRKCNQTEGAEEATPSTSSSSEDEECEEGLPQEFAAATQFSRHMVANRHDPALVAQESRQEKQMTRMLMMEAAKQTNAMRHPEVFAFIYQMENHENEWYPVDASMQHTLRQRDTIFKLNNVVSRG